MDSFCQQMTPTINLRTMRTLHSALWVVIWVTWAMQIVIYDALTLKLSLCDTVMSHRNGVSSVTSLVWLDNVPLRPRPFLPESTREVVVLLGILLVIVVLVLLEYCRCTYFRGRPPDDVCRNCSPNPLVWLLNVGLRKQSSNCRLCWISLIRMA